MRLLRLLIALIVFPADVYAQTAAITNIAVIDGKVLPGQTITVEYTVTFDRVVEYGKTEMDSVQFADGAGSVWYKVDANSQDTAGPYNAVTAIIGPENQIRHRYQMYVSDLSFIDCGDDSRCLPFLVEVFVANAYGQHRVQIARKTERIPIYSPPISEDQLATRDVIDPGNSADIDPSATNPINLGPGDWGLEKVELIDAESDQVVSSLAAGQLFRFRVTLDAPLVKERFPAILYRFLRTERKHWTLLPINAQNASSAGGGLSHVGELRIEDAVNNERWEMEFKLIPDLQSRDVQISDSAVFEDGNVQNNQITLSIPIEPPLDLRVDSVQPVGNVHAGQYSPGDTVSLRVHLNKSGAGEVPSDLGVTLVTGYAQQPTYTLPVPAFSDPGGGVSFTFDDVRIPEEDFRFAFSTDENGSVWNLLAFLHVGGGGATRDADPSNDRLKFSIPIRTTQEQPAAPSDPTVSLCRARCYERCEGIGYRAGSVLGSACSRWPALAVCASQRNATLGQVQYCKRAACSTSEAMQTCEPTGLTLGSGAGSGGGDSGNGGAGGGGSDGGGGPDGGGPDGGGPGGGGPDGGGGSDGGGPDGGGPDGGGPNGGGPHGGGPDGGGGSGGGVIPPRCYWHACGWGDPHLISFDGVKFDFQGAGEYWLARTRDGEYGVQARMEASGSSVSVVSALAIKSGNNRIMIRNHKPNPISIDGEPLSIEPGLYNAFSDERGLYIVRRSLRDYTIVLPNDLKVRVTTGYAAMSFDISAPDIVSMGLDGLLGSADNDPANDAILANGAVLSGALSSLAREDLYDRLGNSWRVTGADSVFDYDEGKSADDYNVLSFPERVLSTTDLEADVRQRAEKLCREPGVVVAGLLNDCIYDVGFSGDERFADDYVNAATSISLPALGNEARLTAPQTVQIGSQVRVGWVGPANNGDFISLARANEPGGRYESWAGAAGAAVSLTAPSAPGEYEVRYVRYENREIIARRSITVVGAEATLDAAAAAEVGSQIAVRWTGPGNKNDFISLARADEPGGRYESWVSVGAAGAAVSLTAPSAPGEYEVRYVLYEDRQIIARRPVTVVGTAATLDAPAAAEAGTKIAVRWTGPSNKGDFISFARPDQPGGQYETWSDLSRDGAPVSLNVPTTPGEYEIRYVLFRDRVIVERRQISVR
ncbi:MAG: VWD domain-containing protein [Pseudomonadota bacterium]